MKNLNNFNQNFTHPTLDIFQKYNDPLPRPQPSDIIVNLFDHKKDLFFIDVGAHNGINSSNSLVLEEGYNWKGMCFEPNRLLYNKLIKSRKCECHNLGISSFDKEMMFVEIDGLCDALSGFIDFFTQEHKLRIERELKGNEHQLKKVIVKSKPLQTILNDKNIFHVDYLSIDAECADFEVIKSVDFSKTHISVLSHESQSGKDDEKDKEIKKYLDAHNFTFFLKCQGDNIFVNRKDFIL